MTSIRLTRKGFREWLEGKPGGERIGSPCDPYECPVARYLQSAGMKAPSVTQDSYGPRPIVKDDEPMPKWAWHFIYKIDKCGYYRITARQALAVLDGKGAP